MTTLIYRNATFFDGTGRDPILTDLEVVGGKVAAIGRNLPVCEGAVEIDCTGLWLMPGLLDIHTHLDLEVELAPELPEVVRHGTTTVVIGNCSLGMAFGHQRSEAQDPIVDCFARVENVPKKVLSRVADACTWTTTRGYLEHLRSLPLGPNVVPLVPHSMLRIQVMGLHDSINRAPTSQELAHMEKLLEAGMAEGYVGFSTDALPFHFLANRPNTRKRIPAQFASFKELRQLTDVVRKYGRVWQATPPKDSAIAVARTFMLSCGRLYGRPLKLTAVAALDLHTNRSIAKLGLVLSAILNSKLLKGNFRFQALSATFRLWSDGVINPMSEEIPELRLLNEFEFDDREGRARVFNDPLWVASFRKMWLEGKKGLSVASLLRVMKRESNVLNRRLDDMWVADCPLAHWKGHSLQEPYERLLKWQASGRRSGAWDDRETAFFAGFPSPIVDDAAFFLHLLREWDTDLRWEATVANRDSKIVKKLLFHPQTLPGFNDSGAHLANLAFYDGNLRTLQIAQTGGISLVASAIQRLTQLPAAFFGIDAGHLRLGASADLCVVDPAALRRWNPEATYEFKRRDLFDCNQMVNRPEGVVVHVVIGGRVAWDRGGYTEAFGQSSFGRLLTAADHPSAVGQ